jgi:hypothetical protein
MKTEPTEKEKLIELLEVGISNCQDDLDAASWAYEEDILISKRDAVALLDLAQSSPKIKQLEWDFYGLYYDVKTAVGHYMILQGDEQYLENHNTCTLTHNGNLIADFNSIDEAKAAAQEHFEKRIKECLE